MARDDAGREYHRNYMRAWRALHKDEEGAARRARDRGARMSFLLGPGRCARLKALAAEHGTTMTELVRLLIDREYLARVMAKGSR